MNTRTVWDRYNRYNRYIGGAVAALLAGAAWWGQAVPAQACGGLFCNANQPVNQAAERIIFKDNGDGTTTAIIQIMYQGPGEEFSWVLPISSAPESPDDVGVSSDLVFQRLQGATNPQYNLNTVVEGECATNRAVPASDPGDSFNNTGTDAAAPEEADSGVSVVAEGSTGPFDWQVIEVNLDTPSPVDDATSWLEDNGYDVGALGPDLMAEYLEQNMFLMGFKLQKGRNAGSIRPVVLTYDGGAGIPIKLTKVAANDDMGVMVWVLGEQRAVPGNYLSLELNEAKINWFNANSNYNDVVTQAADEADGQGFVAEYAGGPEIVQDRIWTQGEQQQWQSFTSGTYDSAFQMYQRGQQMWGSYDGFGDALRTPGLLTLPADATIEDFLLCPNCYSDSFEMSPSAFIAALEEHVVGPMREAQQLLDETPYMTRLYTTMSAEEMTRDPWFTFNGELPDIDNVHTADRVIECSPDVTRFEAPWRVEFDSGHVIRGQGNTWPLTPEEDQQQPAAWRILSVGESGMGEVESDNSTMIKQLLAANNEDFPAADGSPGEGADGGEPVDPPSGTTGGDAGDGSDDTASGGGAGSGGVDSGADDSMPPDRMLGGFEMMDAMDSSGDGGGCSVSGAGGERQHQLALWLAALGAVWWRRRRS